MNKQELKSLLENIYILLAEDDKRDQSSRESPFFPGDHVLGGPLSGGGYVPDIIRNGNYPGRSRIPNPDSTRPEDVRYWQDLRREIRRAYNNHNKKSKDGTAADMYNWNLYWGMMMWLKQHNPVLFRQLAGEFGFTG